MSEPGRTCGLYLPGHDVHWIQALHSASDAEHRPEAGRLLDISSDGTVVVEVAGDRRHLWYHDPDRLARLVAPNDGNVSHQPRWGLLRTPSVDGQYTFCVVDADEPGRRPCPPRPPTGNLTELLEEAGGFSLPLEDLEALLEAENTRGGS